MSDLLTLRRLIATSGGPTQTGLVTGVDVSGAVQVLIGSRVLTCTTTIPVMEGNRVRVQGLVILSKIQQVVKDVPIFRV